MKVEKFENHMMEELPSNAREVVVRCARRFVGGVVRGERKSYEDVRVDKRSDVAKTP